MEEHTGSNYEFSTKDFVNSFIKVTKTVFFKPSDFYQHMPTTGGFKLPVVFFAVCVGVTSIISAIIWWNLANFFYFFIFNFIFSFIGAGILHLIAQQFFEGKGTYEGVYRVVAYAGVVYLVTWLPWIFATLAVFAGLYGLYLQIVGLEKVHQITPGQAVVTVLIAFAFYLIFGLLSSMGGNNSFGIQF
jgi:hypothetical protein